MENLNDFIDSWMKSQKEFMENWVKSQKEFMEYWTESIKKMQESFMSMGGHQEGPSKEILSLYNTWLSTMLNSSRSFTSEAEKIQQTWKNAVESQLEASKEMMKNFSEFFTQAGKK